MPSVPVSSGGCRSRQSQPSFVLIHRSGRRGYYHLCYRAAGGPGAGYILIIPLAIRSSSLNVKLSHCWTLIVTGEALLMLSGTAHFSVRSSAHTHDICQPAVTLRNGMTKILIKQISILSMLNYICRKSCSISNIIDIDSITYKFVALHDENFSQ